MMLLKACSRCGGDLHETSDIYGRYHQCMQCGYVRDLPDEIVATAKATASKSQDKTGAAA